MASLKSIALVIAACLSLAQVQVSGFEFMDCDGGVAPNKKVVLGPCPDTSGHFCEIQNGTNYHYHVSFVNRKLSL